MTQPATETPYTTPVNATYRTSKPVVELSLVDRLRAEATAARTLYPRMFHGEVIESVSAPLNYGAL